MNNDQMLTIYAIRGRARDTAEREGSSFTPIEYLDDYTRRYWQNRLFAALGELGFDRDNRDQRLKFLATIFNRPITSANELSWPECEALSRGVGAPTIDEDLKIIAEECKGAK